MSTRFQELPIRQLAIHPKNVRRDVGIVTDLANSITAQGIMQPLVVAPLTSRSTGVTYVIIAGHRRHAAAQLANLDVIPCVIREDLNTEPKQLEAMLVENTQRTDLTVMEEARGFQALFEFPGYTAKTVAKSVGRSQKFVKDRAKLTELPQGAIAKLENHQMTLEDAMVFAEFSDIPEATADLLSNHGSYNWSYSLQQWRQEVKRRAVAATTVANLEAIGADVTEPVDTYGNDGAYVSAGRFRDFEGWTDEQHVAAGHKVFPSPRDGAAVWILARADAPEERAFTPRPETPEETADRLRVEALDAGLKIAAHVRREHLKAAILEPSAEVLEFVRKERIDSIAGSLSDPLAGELFDLPEDPSKAQVREAIQDLTCDQLAALQIIANRSYEEREMEKTTGWGPQQWGGDYCAKHRKQVAELFGYTFSDIEREAAEYTESKRAAQEAAKAARNSEADDEDQEEEDYDDE